jgi:formate hydrogenlyase subunit 4
VLEYSGRHLAMIEWAAALKLTAYLSLIACLFVPFGMATTTDDPRLIAIGLGSYFAKLIGLGVAVALVEVVVAKMRVFRVADFVGAAFVLASMATLLLFVSRGF